MTPRTTVTGAWMPGDPPGQRRFFTFATDRGFALDGGAALTDVTLAYETWGSSTPTADNAVLLCHAWTGDSHVAGPAGRGHPTPGWWEGVVGPGLAIDTDRWFVVCANVLGGCQGSTGPASPHPADGTPVRLAVPGDHDPRHGAGPGPPGRPPRRRRVACRARRLDGRHAGPGVGDHVPGAGAGGRCRSPRACRPRRSRSRGERSGGGPSRSTRNGAAATTTTPRRATARSTGWPSPAWWPR